MNANFRVISSPCVQKCKINPATSQCDGCGRTLNEIANWSRMTEAQRLAIMADLSAQRGKTA